MKVYRTKVNSRVSDWLDGTAKMLENAYSWLKVERNEEGDEDGNKYIRFFVTDTIYIEMNLSSSNVRTLTVKDTLLWDDKEQPTMVNSSVAYHNMSIFKANDDCIGISVVTNGDKSIKFSNECSLFIDTFKDAENSGKMVIAKNGSGVYVADGYTHYVGVYVPYTSSNSYRDIYQTSQFTPFVSPYSGKQADNINGILLANQMNTIVDIDGSKWLFTNGFALPCGNKIEYVRE